MADSTPVQHVQFGDEIQPVETRNSLTVYSQARNDHSALDEKGEHVDLEDRAAVEIANEDLNKKNKQVSGFGTLTLPVVLALIYLRALDLHRLDAFVALISVYRSHLW